MLAVALLAVGAVVVFSDLPPGDTPPAAALTGGSTPVPEIVEPDTLSSEDFVTRVLPDGTCAITAWKGTGTSVTIPAKINGRTVTVIEDNVFLDKTALTSVTLPEGLTTLGRNAFANCENLTGITLPDSLTAIGGGAFWQCFNLETITLPRSLTAIGDGAFERCYILMLRVPAGSFAERYCRQQGLTYQTY